MKKTIIFVLLSFLILFSSCQHSEVEFSGILHEDAVVMDAVYTPSKHETHVGLTAFKSGSIGMDFNGDLGVRVGSGLQISGSTIPEKFAVVFKCQHGSFIVEREELYKSLKNHIGDTVVVDYREVYKVKYEKDEEGKEKVDSRLLIDLDFLDARLK